MNEFSGGVLLAQLRKLDTIIGDVRRNARRVYGGLRDLPGVHPRHLPDPQGELGTGIFLGFRTKEDRQRYADAMKAEGVPVSSPGGSVILPIVPEIEQKVTGTPREPSVSSDRRTSIPYDRECCPRTIDILNRFARVMMNPNDADRATDDALPAVRKSHPAIVRA